MKVRKAWTTNLSPENSTIQGKILFALTECYLIRFSIEMKEIHSK